MQPNSPPSPQSTPMPANSPPMPPDSPISPQAPPMNPEVAEAESSPAQLRARLLPRSAAAILRGENPARLKPPPPPPPRNYSTHAQIKSPSIDGETEGKKHARVRRLALYLRRISVGSRGRGGCLDSAAAAESDGRRKRRASWRGKGRGNTASVRGKGEMPRHGRDRSGRLFRSRTAKSSRSRGREGLLFCTTTSMRTGPAHYGPSIRGLCCRPIMNEVFFIFLAKTIMNEAGESDLMARAAAAAETTEEGRRCQVTWKQHVGGCIAHSKFRASPQPCTV